MTQMLEKEQVVIEEVEKTFIRFADISRECGVAKTTPFTWSNYHGYFRRLEILGVVVAPRSEYDKFRQENPHLIKKSTTSAIS